MQAICFSKAHRHPPHPPVETCGVLCLSESRAGTARNAGEGSLSREPSECKAYVVANALVMRAISSLKSWLCVFCSQADNTQTVCIPTCKEAQQGKTHSLRCCPLSPMFVFTRIRKIKSDNGQTTPNKTHTNRALAG